MSGGQSPGEEVALTGAERSIWLASAISPNPAAYNAACIIAIEGRIERRRLADAIRQAVGGVAAAKVVLKRGKLEWAAVDASGDVFELGLEASCFADGASLLSDIFWKRPLRADAASLIRVQAVRIRAELTLVMVMHHHVLLDFYANGALVRNVATLYSGERLSAPATRRGDIVSAEKAYLASAQCEGDAHHWQTRMKGVGVGALWSPLRQYGSGGRFDLTVSPEEFAAFTASVRALGASPFHALLLIIYAHLSASGADIVFAVPFANRNADHAQTLASLSRIVPFRVALSPGAPAKVALAQIRSALKADLARARFPIWENAERVFGGSAHGALPRVALNYMRASTLKFGEATGAITKVLYGERNAETYIRCIEEADGRLSISIDDARDVSAAERLGRAMQAAIANWRCAEDEPIGALCVG